MKALITGGAGFVGSHIVESFIERGVEVRVLDDFSTGSRENLAGAKGRAEIIEGSLVDEKTVRRAAEGMDVIVHQGALPSVPRSHQDPAASNDANVRGTLNVLLAARDAGAPRVVTASSSSVYGDTPTLPKVETQPPSPLSIYAATKLIGEHYGRVFADVFGLTVVCLRYFNVFGPRQDPASQYAAVIPKFITCIAAGEPPPVNGDGSQSRDFTYIANVVHANWLAATVKDVPKFLACNIACGERVDLLELISMINRILGKDVKPAFNPPRPGDVRHSLADIGLARAKLGYEPVMDFERGLEKTVEYFAGALRHE